MSERLSRRQIIRGGVAALASGVLLPSARTPARGEGALPDPQTPGLEVPPPRGLTAVTSQLIVC